MKISVSHVAGTPIQSTFKRNLMHTLDYIFNFSYEDKKTGHFASPPSNTSQYQHVPIAHWLIGITLEVRSRPLRHPSAMATWKVSLQNRGAIAR